ILEMPEARVRVIAPDVGGGFGVKTGPYREEVLLAWLARRLGRPVKWIATRGEDQITTNHSRGSVCEAELAVEAHGRVPALRARTSPPPSAVPAGTRQAARRGTTRGCSPAAPPCPPATSR